VHISNIFGLVGCENGVGRQKKVRQEKEIEEKGKCKKSIGQYLEI